MPLNNIRWPQNLSFPAVIQKVKTEGVLTPLLWLCGILIIATLVSAALNSPVMWVFAALSALASAWVLRGFEFFKTENPNALQSEKFQLEYQKQQNLLVHKSDQSTVIDHEPVANPHIAPPTKGPSNA